MGTSKILRDFAGWTSAHGIPHIGSARNEFLRAFWTIVFFFSTGMFAYQTVLLVQKYTSFDVTVQTQLKFEERAFPAVTVCNLNPYSYSRVQKFRPEIQDLMISYQNAMTGKMTINTADKWKLMDSAQSNASIALQSKTQENLIFVASGLTEDEKNQIVFDYADFIMNCAYNTRPCGKDDGMTSIKKIYGDFLQRIDPVYGACYTFNYISQPNTKYNSTRAGPLYGLRLLLKSAQDDYLPLTESAGVRVVVHGQNEEPFPDAFGFNAAAGFTTAFGINYIHSKRLPAPYGNCTATRDGFKYYYSGDYTVEGCFRSCFQAEVVAKCQCADPRLQKANGMSYCDYQNQAKRDCVSSFSKVTQKFGNGGDENWTRVSNCACPQPCDESTYGVTVSTALWPSDAYTPPDCQSDEKPCKNCTTLEECTKWYNENTMLIEVFYERMNYEELSESEAYSLVNLVSDLGGQLGLWLGISVITMVEFISLLVLLCLYCMKSNKNNQDQAYQDQADSNKRDRYILARNGPPVDPYVISTFARNGPPVDPYVISTFDSRYGPVSAPIPN